MVRGCFRLTGVITLATIGALLIACGSNTNGGGNGGSAGGLVFPTQFNFAGTYAVQGSFEDNWTANSFNSCSGYASKGLDGTVWSGPSPSDALPVGGHSVKWTSPGVGKSQGFKGAGTYSGKEVLVGVTIDGDLMTGTTAPETVQINADGSGKLTFSEFVGAHSGPESGTISWTCKTG